jgi:hypothetical protein
MSINMVEVKEWITMHIEEIQSVKEVAVRFFMSVHTLRKELRSRNKVTV